MGLSKSLTKFAFWRKSRFFAKNSDSVKILNFGENLMKILDSDENLGFRWKLKIQLKISDFGENLGLDENLRFRRKSWTLAKIWDFGKNLGFERKSQCIPNPFHHLTFRGLNSGSRRYGSINGYARLVFRLNQDTAFQQDTVSYSAKAEQDTAR